MIFQRLPCLPFMLFPLSVPRPPFRPPPQLSGTLPAQPFVGGSTLAILKLDFNAIGGSLAPLRLPDTLKELTLAWNRIGGQLDGWRMPTAAWRYSLGVYVCGCGGRGRV